MMFSNVHEVSKDIISSVVGSAACVYTGQPFDTVKVRMQVNPSEFAGGIQCLKKTVSNEAVSSLWKGSVPAFAGALAENAVAFGINGCLKRILKPLDNSSSQEVGKINWKQPVAIGGITGIFTAVVLCPSDVIKCRAQMTSSASGQAAQTLRSLTSDIITQRGYRGLFTGLNAQLLRDIPFGAAFFGSYEVLCQVFKKHTKWSDSTVFFMSGG